MSSVIRMMLDKPMVDAFAINVVTPKDDWRQGVCELMMKQKQGEVSSVDSKLIAYFLFIGDDLYRRGYTTPLLNCLSDEDANYVM